MPLYEYLCEVCGERAEILQRFGDLPEVICPICGGPMRRLPSAPSFQFKGSGFYQTDYARKPGGTEESSPRGTSDKVVEQSAGKSSDKGGDSSAGKGESSSAEPGAGRDSATRPSAEAAPPNAAPVAPAVPDRKKPVTSGGE